MDIVQVDPRDSAAVQTLHRIYTEVGYADNPETFVAAPAEEIQEVLRAPTARFSFTAFLGFDDGAPVASGWSAFDIKDNPALAYLTPRVLPAHRRRGHGTQILEAMESHAAVHGRTLFQTFGVWVSAAGADGATAAPVRFAASRGWEHANTDARQRLELPAGRAAQDALLAQRAGRRKGYSTRAWAGPVPEELLADWAVLHAAVSADAPHGSLDAPAEAVDADAIRDDERILAQTGQLKVNAAAISAQGEVVAYASLRTRIGAAEPAFAQGTIVRRDHRGRGLGALVKVQALRLLEQTRPDIPAVITENALQNEPMLAINRALGWVPVLYSGDFQKRAG